MTVRALREIKNGEEITVSYIELYQSRWDRKSELYFTKMMKCECERCTKEMKDSIDKYVEGYLCQDKQCKIKNKGEGLLFYFDEKMFNLLNDLTLSETEKENNKSIYEKQLVSTLVKCQYCNYTCPASDIDKASKSALSLFLSSKDLFDKENFDQSSSSLQPLLSQYSPLFHTHHALLFSAKSLLVNCLINQKNYNEAISSNLFSFYHLFTFSYQNNLFEFRN